MQTPIDPKEAVVKAIQRGETRLAKKLLAACKSLRGRDADIHLLEAMLALREGQQDWALELITQGLSQAPDHAGLWATRAQILERLGQTEAAMESYLEVMAHGPAAEQGPAQAALERLADPPVLPIVDPARMVAPPTVAVAPAIGDGAPAPDRSAAPAARPPTAPATAGDGRLVVITPSGYDYRVDGVLKPLQAFFEVDKVVAQGPDQVGPAMMKASLCWVDSCGPLLVAASHHARALPIPLIARLQGEALFDGHLAEVYWPAVSALVVASETVGQMVRRLVPGLESQTRLIVIPPGVTTADFPLRPRRPGFRIATGGHLTMEKNPMLLLQVLARLVREDARYHLYVAGMFRDAQTRLGWNYQVRAMGLEQHVHFEGWQDDLASWLDDKHYLLATGLTARPGPMVAEAMSRGLKAIVHNVLGVHDFWPEEMLFNTVDEAMALIQAPRYEPAVYHSFIAQHYSRTTEVTALRTLLTQSVDRMPAVLQTGRLRQVVQGL